jgi:hypothetical protein
MLRDDRRCLSRLRAIDPTSLSPPLYISFVSLKNIFLLGHRTLYSIVWPPALLRNHHSGLVLPPRALVLRCSVLAPARRAPHPRVSLLAPTVPPAARPPTPSGVPPASASVGGAVACLRSVPTEPRATTSVAVLVVLARYCSVPAPAPRPESTGPSLFLPLCCKCRCYQRYIASVSYGYCKSRSECCICCKCFRCMLQVFQRLVASVYSKCFICFRRMLQAFFYLDVAHISHIYYNSLFEIF